MDGRIESELSSPLLRNARNDLGDIEATIIQKRAFLVIRSGRDIGSIAQTETDKAFDSLPSSMKILQQ